MDSNIAFLGCHLGVPTAPNNGCISHMRKGTHWLIRLLSRTASLVRPFTVSVYGCETWSIFLLPSNSSVMNTGHQIFLIKLPKKVTEREKEDVMENQENYVTGSKMVCSLCNILVALNRERLHWWEM
jgi:hypothetical protein